MLHSKENPLVLCVSDHGVCVLAISLCLTKLDGASSFYVIGDRKRDTWVGKLSLGVCVFLFLFFSPRVCVWGVLLSGAE